MFSWKWPVQSRRVRTGIVFSRRPGDFYLQCGRNAQGHVIMTPAKSMHRGHQVSSTKQKQVSLSGHLVKAAENREEGESRSWGLSQLCPLERSSSDHSLLGRAWSSKDSGGPREAEAMPSSPCYSSAFSLFGGSDLHTAFIGKHDDTKQDCCL